MISLKQSVEMRSPFRFVGSKYQAIRYLKPIWESVNHDEYREPMVGGGAVFFAKPKVRINWLNDLDEELIITYSAMKNPDKRYQLIKSMEKEIPTKERHQYVKTAPYQKDTLSVARRYYFLNRTSYSGIMHVPPYGYSDTKSVPPSRWGDRIKNAGEKLTRTKLTSVDFTHVINAPQKGMLGVFMFIDPPYFLADQKRAYIHSFEEKDHFRLCKMLKNTHHNFCLTYDDCEQIHDMYDWAHIKAVSWRYHVANSNKSSRKMGNELIITNFKID